MNLNEIRTKNPLYCVKANQVQPDALKVHWSGLAHVGKRVHNVRKFSKGLTNAPRK